MSVSAVSSSKNDLPLPAETEVEKALVSQVVNPHLDLGGRLELTTIVTDYYFSEHHINYQRHLPQRIITLLTPPSVLGPLSGWEAPRETLSERLIRETGVVFYYEPTRHQHALTPICITIVSPLLPHENGLPEEFRPGFCRISYEFRDQKVVERRAVGRSGDFVLGTVDRKLNKAVEVVRLQLQRLAFDKVQRKVVLLFQPQRLVNEMIMQLQRRGKR